MLPLSCYARKSDSRRQFKKPFRNGIKKMISTVRKSGNKKLSRANGCMGKFLVPFLFSIFEAATAHKFAHDAGRGYLLVANGQEVGDELQETMGL